MRKYLLIGALCVSGLAFAVVQAVGSVSRVNDPKPQHFLNGMFIGTDGKNPLSNIKNKQAYHLCATADYDFPALVDGLAGLEIVCDDSSAITLTGCGFNDRLSVGIDQAKVNSSGMFQAHVTAASTVKITACGMGITDGGSFDQPDSGFTVCCDGF